MKYECFKKVLRKGKHNALQLQDIMTVCDVRCRRQAYKIMEDLINKHGVPVGSNRTGENRGYFIIGNKKELHDVVREQSAAINSQQKKLNNLMANYRTEYGLISDKKHTDGMNDTKKSPAH